MPGITKWLFYAVNFLRDWETSVVCRKIALVSRYAIAVLKDIIFALENTDALAAFGMSRILYKLVAFLLLSM
jgi:hypothetical protein